MRGNGRYAMLPIRNDERCQLLFNVEVEEDSGIGKRVTIEVSCIFYHFLFLKRQQISRRFVCIMKCIAPLN